MSEPNALFARVTIRPQAWAAFLAAPPAIPVIDDDWQAWWDSRERLQLVCEESPLVDYLHGYDDSTNQAVIDGWLSAPMAIAASTYDPQNGVWYFSINEFSENYGEILPMLALAFLKAIAPFKEDNSDDFAVVYDFFYGDDSVMAFLGFTAGKAYLDPNIACKTQLDPYKLAQADTQLEQQWNAYAKMAGIDDD